MLNNIDLKGMRVAITGGTSGLGLALVRNLAASRARVAFVARRAQLVEAGRQRAGQLRWQTAADAHVKLWRSML